MKATLQTALYAHRKSINLFLGSSLSARAAGIIIIFVVLYGCVWSVVKPSVVAISCQPLLLNGLLRAVESQRSFNIVASSLSAREAPALVACHRPSIVILDSGEPDRGLATLNAILRERPATKVVFLTCEDNVDHAVRALESGAAGYLSSRSTEDELLSALCHVLDDATYVSPTLATAVIAAMRSAALDANTDRRTGLSTREEQIAEHLLLGHTNREIAGCLGLREKTVKHYMTILMQKFEVRNRLELALCLERPAALGAAGVVSAWARRNVGPGGRLHARAARTHSPSANAA